MHLLQDFGVQARARSIRVPGVRARSGGEDSDKDRDEHDRARDVGEGSIPGRNRESAWHPAGVDPVHEDGAQRHQDHGDHEVEADHIGVQLGEHADAADDGLRGNSETSQQGQPKQVRALLAKAHHGEERRDGNQAEGDTEQAVAEFDEAVDAHLRRVDQ